jgi:hypothetical protein
MAALLGLAFIPALRNAETAGKLRHGVLNAELPRAGCV